MNLKELDSFKISDAISFHDELNPNLWNNQTLRPEVKEQLLIIAKDFLEELGVSDLDVKDITVSGSNAAYSYTPYSDLDLHILVDMSDMDNDEIYRELFNAKKSIYNDTHDITIHGVPVELYVQDAREPVVSLGEYSILQDKWLRIPTKRRANLDQTATKQKYTKLLDIIKRTLKSKNIVQVSKVIQKIKQYRKAGLDKGGEFGPENLAYKILRKQGLIDKLYNLRDKLHSETLTIEDYDPNGPPPGPEFKPTMPKGTVRVDVSDVYDWYKLGQHISNMKGLGKHDFGKGPPSTIMAFGSEPEEHKYIKDLEKTGLTTTDIDPIDKNQPKGMKRQKVDPTYNVNEDSYSMYPDQYSAEKTLPVTPYGNKERVFRGAMAEAFDQPYKLKWEKGEFGDMDALAKLDDGTNLSIMFNLADMSENDWGVEFYRNNSQSVTGEGDAQRVFATVLTAIGQFIKKKKPDTLFFTAVKEEDPTGSRAKLYDRLVQRYATGLGYNLSKVDYPQQVGYQLTRKEQKVTEASGYIPSEKEKNDPRFKTALTVDVHPNTMKKDAKKFGNKITRAGIPPTANPNGKF